MKMLMVALVSGLVLSASAFVRIDPAPAPDYSGTAYAVTVPDGATVTIDAWIAEHGEVGEASVLVKDGSGTLKVDTDTLATFAGDIHVKAGRYDAVSRKAFGTAAGATFVDAGADVRLSAAAEIASQDLFEHVYISGTGTGGSGAIVTENTTSSQISYIFPKFITLLGDAKIHYKTCRMKNVCLNLNGYTLTTYNAGWDWTYWESGVASNGCIRATGATFLYQGAKFAGMADNVITFAGESGYRGYNNASGQGSADALWTQVYENGALIFAGGGNSGWSGPVVLQGVSPLKCQNQWTSMTFWGPVSGPGTIGGSKTKGDGTGYNCATIRMSLYNATNSFTGGAWLYRNILDLQHNGAMPAAGAKIIAEKSTVNLKASGEYYYLPGIEMTGTGMVNGACGEWREGFVKKGTGEVVYNSFVGGDLLDIQGGSVRVASPGNVGLWECCYQPTAEMGNPSTLSAAFFTGSETPEGCVKAFPNLLYLNNYNGGSAYWKANAVVVYSGYLWNRGETDVTWTFASCYDDGSKIYINDKLVIDQSGWTTVKLGKAVLHPGANRFVFRSRDTGGGAGASTWKGWNVAKALSFYEGETTSTDPATYTAFTAENSKTYFTPTKGTEDDLSRLLPTFRKIRLAAGTAYDTATLPCRAADVEGCGSFTNGSLTVTNLLIATAADLAAGHALAVSNRLTLAAGAKIDVSSVATLRHRTAKSPYVLATANEIVAEDPQTSDALKEKHWNVVLSEDRKKLLLYYECGLMLFLR